MNKNHSVLLKVVYPALVMGFMLATQAHAVEQSTTDGMRKNDMPPAPIGPYRSTHDVRQPAQAPVFDNRQWTRPSPPHWMQQKARQVPLQQAEQTIEQENKTKPAPQPVPPQWLQQQRRQIPMQQPVPPQWLQQQRRQTPMQQPVPPQWMQQQTRQQPIQRFIPPPPWVTQQRRQYPVQPPVSPQWRQRPFVPPAYAHPPFVGYPPYWLNRR